MNIFFLHDTDATKCAMWHVDAHVRKMGYEYAQLLTSAHGVYFGRTCVVPPPSNFGYKYPVSVPQHPCAIWTRFSAANYVWLHDLLTAICDEHMYRFGTAHYIEHTGILDDLADPPMWLNAARSVSCPPQAVPDIFKTHLPVDAYRNYYRVGKARDASGRIMHRWTRRSPPPWL